MTTNTIRLTASAKLRPIAHSLFPECNFARQASVQSKHFSIKGNYMLTWIRQNLLWYRILLGTVLTLVWLAFNPVIAIYYWVLFLMAVGKFYEIFCLRGGQDWRSTGFSLKLMMMSKLAENLWNGFRDDK